MIIIGDNMKKGTKIFILITVITVAILTALDIQTKGKITSLVGSVNPMNLKSSDVAYTNNSQSTVQGAIDDLYEQANTWIDPSYIDFTTLATNTNKTILASKNGVCIKRNNKVSCFKINNWAEEQNHIQQVFSDISCNVSWSHVGCSASDFGCDVSSNGDVRCDDYSGTSNCYVYSGGRVNCK